jgi:hypothetical protein
MASYFATFEEDQPLPDTEQVLALWRSSGPVSDDAEVGRWLRGELDLDVEVVAGADLARALPVSALGLPSWARRKGPWSYSGHRLLLPLYDSEGRMRSVRAHRIITPDDDLTGKVTPRGFSAAGLFLANPKALSFLRMGAPDGGARSCPDIVIVDDVVDYLGWSTGRFSGGRAEPSVIGLLGGSWTPELARRMPMASHVVLALSSDLDGELGRQIEEDLRARVGSGGVSLARWEPGWEPAAPVEIRSGPIQVSDGFDDPMASGDPSMARPEGAQPAASGDVFGRFDASERLETAPSVSGPSRSAPASDAADVETRRAAEAPTPAPSAGAAPVEAGASPGGTARSEGPPGGLAALEVRRVLGEVEALARRRATGAETPIPLPWRGLGERLGGGLWPGAYALVVRGSDEAARMVASVALCAARAGAPTLLLSGALGRIELAAQLLGLEACRRPAALLLGADRAAVDGVGAHAARLAELPLHVRAVEAPDVDRESIDALTAQLVERVAASGAGRGRAALVVLDRCFSSSEVAGRMARELVARHGVAVVVAGARCAPSDAHVTLELVAMEGSREGRADGPMATHALTARGCRVLTPGRVLLEDRGAWFQEVPTS